MTDDTHSGNEGNIDSKTSDYSVFCSKELDHLLASVNTEPESIYSPVDQVPMDIKYNIPTKQAGYVKTLEDALNKNDRHRTTPCALPNPGELPNKSAGV